MLNLDFAFLTPEVLSSYVLKGLLFSRQDFCTEFVTGKKESKVAWIASPYVTGPRSKTYRSFLFVFINLRLILLFFGSHSFLFNEYGVIA